MPLLIVLGLSIVALVGALAAMLVLRFRGRSVPTWLVRVAIVVLGLQSGLATIVFIRQPIMLASVGLQTAVVGWFLWRAGRRATTGILLLATGLPGTLWWGFFLVQDIFQESVSYQAVLWAWWAPSVVLVLAGGLLLLQGDHPLQRPIFPHAPSLARDPMAIGNAISRELSIGPLPLPTVIADGLALMVAAVGIGLWGHLVPWPVAWIVAVAAYTLIATELFYFAIARRLRRAWEGMALVGSPQMIRWRTVSGTPVPLTVASMRSWLRDQPDRPETRWARAELQGTLGDLEAARGTTAAMPTETDADRFEQRSLLAWLNWLDGEDQDLDALSTEAEAVGEPDSPERADARGRVALARARDLLVRGGDWKAPLEAFQREHGQGSPSVLQRDLRRARFRSELLFALFLTGGVLILQLLAG